MIASGVSKSCSTPFGDIDQCTVIVSPSIFASSLCSTPFGDIDQCTEATRPNDERALFVLNAFRRH